MTDEKFRQLNSENEAGLLSKPQRLALLKEHSRRRELLNFYDPVRLRAQDERSLVVEGTQYRLGDLTEKFTLSFQPSLPKDPHTKACLTAIAAYVCCIAESSSKKAKEIHARYKLKGTL